MTIDSKAPISRRGLFAAVAGAIGVAAVGTVTKVERAFAAGDDGQTVVIGGKYDDVRSTTRFHNVTDDKPVMQFGRIQSTPWQPEQITITGGTRPAIELVRQAEGPKDGGSLTRLTARSISTGSVGSTTVKSVLGTFSHGVIGDAYRTRSGITGRAVRWNQAGVSGVCTNGVGVLGTGKRGGEFAGNVAPVRMRPSKKATHPKRGRRGDFFVDKSGRLWFCRAGTDWKQLA